MTVQTDGLADYWAWLEAALARDRAERRGPVLVEWPETATADTWDKDGEVPWDA